MREKREKGEGKERKRKKNREKEREREKREKGMSRVNFINLHSILKKKNSIYW